MRWAGRTALQNAAFVLWDCMGNWGVFSPRATGYLGNKVLFDEECGPPVRPLYRMGILELTTLQGDKH
eukprot:COSAG02_NODE_54928_length_293_cov_1.020619_1_plen_67_part_01